MKKSSYPLMAFLTPIAAFHTSPLRRTMSSSSSCSRLHSSTLTSVPNNSRNKPEWDTQQHLYGLDLHHHNHDDNSEDSNNGGVTTISADGEVSTMTDGEKKSLPLPQTYVRCGRCKSLFAIAESDLGNMGKGW